MAAAAYTPAQDKPPVEKPLGQRLIELGVINESQLQLALREKDRVGGFLGEVLVDLGFVTEETLTNNLAAETQTRVVDVLNTVIDRDVLDLVPYELAKRLQVLPIGQENGTLTVAMADAFNVVTIDQLERETGLQLEIVSATEKDLLEALERHYARGTSIDATVEALLRNQSVSDIESLDSETSLPRLVDQIIALGVKNRATDIHFEPEDKMVRVRMRVDGVLRQEVLLPALLRQSLAARIKLMADLDVTERRIPQDGRIHFLFGRKEVDLRVSTLPTKHGESIVMRILESMDSRPGFDQLGLSTSDEGKLKSVVEQPYGMLLVTGPTGSGKTTTLYSALSQVDVLTRSVFTLEDPVEYSMPMIRQTQIQSDVGMTFAAGLRALLRQDPDVIFVGEIRDQETAQLATRAALTGHLVFSTLHTNSAIACIARLIDMGVEPYLLPNALSAVVGQRLVRTICPSCKQENTNPPDLGSILQEKDLPDEITQLWYGRGCDQCNGSGYRGRMAIYEVLQISDDFHDPILSEAGASELEELASASGMTSMLQDGVRKAFEGHTTIEEVLRVVR